MIEYYLRFPSILRNALKSETVSFPKDLLKDFEPMVAYRAVRFNNDKQIITREDFMSQMELCVPYVKGDMIQDYSCSCFIDETELQTALKLPRKNKKVAIGQIRKEYGPHSREAYNSHIHWYLFENADPAGEFEVI